MIDYVGIHLYTLCYVKEYKATTISILLNNLCGKMI